MAKSTNKNMGITAAIIVIMFRNSIFHTTKTNSASWQITRNKGWNHFRIHGSY